MKNYRIFVEKRPGFRVEAESLQHDLNENLGLHLSQLRLLNVYDLFGFTPELLEKIQAKGVNIGYVTLHVGLGTFRPVKEDDIEQHDMHSEYCVIPPETATLINETKARGGRVICVGTTSCRTLESWAQEDGHMEPSAGWTSIYIYPGYRFKVMDALVTNFHLPQSTLIMLVSALAGREHVLHAYEEAVKERYRFFSFGDAMFVS